MTVGDGTLAGTELSVFEISLHRGTESNEHGAVQLPTILSVEPDQISSEGGDTVRIFGMFFDAFPDPSTAIHVQFGSGEPVVAIVVNSTELVCTAPSTVPSKRLFTEGGYWVLLRLTNLVDFWSNGVQLFVETQPKPLSIFPDAGPSCGGTIVSIFGHNFLPLYSMACVFGDDDGNVTTPATWRGPGMVECTAPPWTLPEEDAYVDVSFVLTSSHSTAATSSSIRRSQISPQQFRYTAPVEVTTISPAMGPVEGGTKVDISISYKSGYDLMCVIGGQIVTSTVVRGDSDTIQCTVPARGSPPNRSFKLKVVSRGDLPERYELINDVMTVTDPSDPSRWGAELGATIIISLVRGQQYWFDQTDDSNSGHAVSFSSDPGGDGWTKGMQRLTVLPQLSSNGDSSAYRAGEGIVSFLVPMDAPDVLYIYSEETIRMEGGIAAIITDEVVYTSVGVVAAHGSSCNPAPHPFRCVSFLGNKYLHLEKPVV